MSDWQNALNRLDASDDGLVTALDALLIINEINSPQLGDADGRLPDQRPQANTPFVDPSGDQVVAAIDALLIINGLNDDETPPVLSLGLERDTGPAGTNDDRLTFDPALRGTVNDDLTGVDRVEVRVDGGTAVAATLDRRTGTFRFLPTGLADGERTYEVRAFDALGNTSAPMAFTFTLDTEPPPAPAFDLSLGSDSGSLHDQTTSAGRVTLVGNSAPHALLELVGRNQSAVASQSGAFQFSQVSLQPGANELQVRVRDAAGNANVATVTIHRSEQEDGVDPVLRWNEELLESIRRDATTPPMASRAMAMVHTAVYAAVNAIVGTPDPFVSATAPVGAALEAAVGAAAHTVLSYLYPGQKGALDAALTETLASVPDGSSENDGVAVGRSVGQSIIDWRQADGWNAFVNHLSGDAPGEWVPTAPMFDIALLPQWAALDTFLLDRPDQFRPQGPPSLNSGEYTAAVAEVQALGRRDSQQRTADQTQIARFWSDGAGTYTPPGHWNQIAHEVAAELGLSLADNARLFALLNVALADAAIASWDAKYAYGFWRPETAIQQAAQDGNPGTAPDAHWLPLLISPPFPEYVSGHSTFSGAAAEVLSSLFGESFAFTSSSPGLPGVERSFQSFREAAAEAGRSRIYGGIHFEFSNTDGQELGRALAAHVLQAFSLATDTIPPRITFTSPAAPVRSRNVTITGRAVDNLAGVSRLEVQFDDGAFAPVSLDPQGGFSVTTEYSLAGNQDGTHRVRFRAEDASGNQATAEYRWTLDTVLPRITLAAPADNAEIAAGAFLAGSVSGTGSPILALSYQLGSGKPRPISFDGASGAFETPLDLSAVPAGAHTVTITTRDAAGNVASHALPVTLNSVIPFELTSFTPLRNATEVGTTFRPQIFFSRAVDSASLNDTNFYATNAAGQKLSARIVPGTDGRFAWLFFAAPLPGGADVTVHVDGGSIRAADGTLLDADRDGAPGGTLSWKFTTVSLTPVLGTSLTGRVVDPGPDLKPMTIDDVRAGPDGALNTPDDEFLLPLAGVKVYIVGMESSAKYTDAQGRFHFDSVPTGNVKIAIDGLTTTSPPAGFYFPEMVMDAQMHPGRVNWVMTEMEDVYLPRLQSAILKNVSSTAPTQVTVDAAAAPNLTPQQRETLTIEIQPNSLVGMDGQLLANGQVGISTVPPELVRDMLPAGLLQHTFDITVQAPGVATFAEPAPMMAPNVFQAAPGTKLNFLSFDHTTGRLVIEGTGTVSADGLYVVTDPGTGITKPGWHGWTPPGGCNGSGGNPAPKPNNPVTPNVTVLEPVFSVGDTTTAGPQKTFRGPNRPPNDNNNSSDPCRPQEPRRDEFVRVRVDVEGPLKQFVDSSGDIPLNRTVNLRPGESRRLELAFKSYADMFRSTGGFTKLNNDRLYGSRITVTEERGRGSTVESEDVTVYSLFRWVDVVDAPLALQRTGDTAAFFKTLQGTSRQKSVDLFLPTGTEATVTGGTGAGDFLGIGALSGGSANWTFRPSGAGTRFADLEIHSKFTIEGTQYDKTVGTITAKGTGVAPTTLSIDKAGFVTVMTNILTKLEITSLPYTVQAGDTLTVLAQTFGVSVRGITAYNNIPDPDLIQVGQNLTIPIPIYRSPSGAVEMVSHSFVQEFDDFMPWSRNNLNAGGRDNDDTFDAAQLTAMASFLSGKGDEVLAAVGDDYRNIPGTLVIAANAGADVQMTWTDEILHPTLGLPVYGRAPMDRDEPFLVNHICSTSSCDIGDAAKLYALAEGLNKRAQHQLPNGGYFAIALNMNFERNTPSVYVNSTSRASFAQSLAFTVSHELAHTFGLVDSYKSSGKPTVPFDIMMSKNRNSGNMRFDLRNEYLLQAALGSQPDEVSPGSLGQQALSLYQQIFDQPDSSVGIHDESEDITEPTLLLSRDAAVVLHGDWDDLGVTLAGGTSQHTYRLTNVGREPLALSRLEVQDTSGAFTVSAAGVAGRSLAFGESAEFTVRFTPTRSGQHTARLVIRSNMTGLETMQVELIGEAVNPRPDSQLSLAGNNNLGGVLVGASQSSADVFTISNQGQAPLQVTAIRIVEGSGFALRGVPESLTSQPISLARGQSFTWGASFAPTQTGLQRAVLEIVTNDSAQPIRRASLVGTGLGATVYPEWGDDYVAIETPQIPNFTTLRAVTGPNGAFEFFMPPSELYHLVMFDPVTGLAADGSGRTAPSGGTADLTSWLVFEASIEPDSDFDGLPDDVEFAIGTLPGQRDSDADGLDDFEEVILGLDPSGSGALPTGIVAGVELPGSANEVVVEAAPGDIQRKTAYVATGEHGLAIVDVSESRRPVVRSLLDLPGNAVDIGVDARLNLAVIAAGEDNLHIVQVANPAAPVLRQTITGLAATQVEIINGVAYVADGAAIRAFDLATGDRLNSFVAPGAGSITGLAREGSMLFTLDEQFVLRAIDTSDFTYQLRGIVTLPDGGGPLFISNGVAFVAARSAGGFLTADVSQPGNLTLISPSDAPDGVPSAAVMPNGSGLAILIGLAFNSYSLDVLNVRDPADTFRFLTRQPLPASPTAVHVASGLAYVANGPAGLQIVNFLGLDTAGLAPTVSLATSLLDAEPAADGFQVLEGTAIPLRVSVNDDTQLRNVELLVNGAVVASAISAPYFFELTAPALGQQLNVQVRATDTGLNAGLSNVLSLTTVRDTAPPQLLASTPEANGAGFSLTEIVLRFHEPLNAAALAAHGAGATLVHLGADGAPGGGDDTVVELASVAAASPFLIRVATSASLPSGDYRLTLPAAAIADRFGNTPLGPVTLEFSAYDVPEGTVAWIADGGGRWNDPANWSSANVPSGEVDVLIDRPGVELRVEIPTEVHVRNLFTKEELFIQGGSLTVTERGLALGGVTLKAGGTLTAVGASAEILATGAVDPGQGHLEALDGGRILLPTVTAFRYLPQNDYYYYGNDIRITAQGAGSVIDLSSTEFLVGSEQLRYGKPIFEAMQGGEIRLGTVRQMRGAVHLTAQGATSRIDLSALSSFRHDSSLYEHAGLAALEGGTIVAPLLTETRGVHLVADGTLAVAQLELVERGSLVVHEQAVTLDRLRSLTGSSVEALTGAQLTIPLIVELSTEFSTDVRFTAQGAGASLSLPNLQRLAREAVHYQSHATLSARDGGRLLLEKLASLESSADIVAEGSGSEIALSALTRLQPAPDTTVTVSEIAARDGGRVRIPNVTRLDFADLYLGGVIETSQLTAIVGGQVTVSGVAADLSQVADLTGSGVLVEGGVAVNLPMITSYRRSQNNLDLREFFATGQGSSLTLPNLTEIVVSGVSYYGRQPLQVRAAEGGQVGLPRLATMSGPVFMAAEGDGSEVHVPVLTQFTSSSSLRGSLATLGEGRLETPLLTKLDGVDLAMDGPMALSQLVSLKNGSLAILQAGASLDVLENIDGSGLSLAPGVSLSLPRVTSYTQSATTRQEWQVQGADALLELPNLTRISAASANANADLVVQLRSGGRARFPALNAITAPTQFDVMQADSVAELPNLTTFIDSNPGPISKLLVRDGSIRIPQLTSLTGVDLIVAGTIDTAQLTSITHGTIDVQKPDTDLSGLTNIDGSSLLVTGGVRLSLPQIQSYTQGGPAFLDREFKVRGANSLIELPGLTRITASPETGAELRLTAETGGRLSLPALTSLLGQAVIASSSAQSEIHLPVLTQFVDSNPGVTSVIAAHNGSRIHMPGITALDNVDLNVSGRIDTAQLTSFRNATLNVSVNNVDLQQLAQLDQASVQVTSGVTLTLPAVTSTRLNGSSTFSASGNNSLLSLPELTTVTGGDGNRDLLNLTAGQGARLSAPKLAAIHTAANIASFSSNSEVDLSGLTTLADDESAATSSITASNGRVRIPLLTELRSVNLTVDGPIETAQLTLLQGGNISVNGDPADFSAVTSIDGSRITVNGGVTVAFPRVTRYQELPGTASSLSLEVAGANSVLSLPGLTSIAGNATLESSRVTLTASSKGRLQLGAVTAITGQLALSASGADSEIDLSQWASFSETGANERSYFRATQGGRIRLTQLKQFERTDLQIGGPVDTSQLEQVVGGSISVLGVTADFASLRNIDHTSVTVEGAVTVSLPQITSYRNDRAPEFYWLPKFGLRANGAGAVLDLPNLARIEHTSTRAGMAIEAHGGAAIRLGAVATLTGTVSVHSASAGSEIDLSSLTSFQAPAIGFAAELNAVDEGRIRIPRITALENVNLYLDGAMETAQLTSLKRGGLEVVGRSPDLANLRNLDGSYLVVSQGGTVSVPQVTSWSVLPSSRINAGRLRATGPGSVLDLPSLGSIDFGANQVTLAAENGGRLQLNRLASLRGASMLHAKGAGSLLDLPALTSLNTTMDYYGYELGALEGGRLRVPLLTSLQGVTLTVDGPLEIGQLTAVTDSAVTVTRSFAPLTNVTNLDGSSLAVGNGVVLRLPQLTSYRTGARVVASFSAEGVNSVLDLSNLASMGLPAQGDQSFYYGNLTLQAEGAGRVDLSRLQGIPSELSLWVEVTGTNSELDLSSIEEIEALDDSTRLHTGTGARIRMPRLTRLEGATLDIGGTMETAQIVSVTRGAIQLRGVPADFPNLTDLTGSSLSVEGGVAWSLPQFTEFSLQGQNVSWTASGPGSRLEFPNLQTISRLNITWEALQLEATGGGKVSLPNVTTLAGATEVRAWDPISEVNLPAVSQFEGLASQQFFSNLIAGGGGRIHLPHVTRLDWTNLNLQSGGFVETNQLTSVTNGQITLSGVAPQFGSLTSIDGSGIALERVSLTLPGITAYESTHGGYRKFGASGDGTAGSSVLSFPNLVTLDTAQVSSPQFYSFNTRLELDARSGGRLDFSQVTRLSGQVAISAWNAGTEIDLSRLVSLHDTDEAVLSEITTNGGRVRMPLLTSLHHVQLNVTGTMDTAQLTAITNGGLYVANPLTDLGNLANIHGSSVDVAANVQLSLPLITSYQLDHAQTRRLQATGLQSRLEFPNLQTIDVRQATSAGLTVAASSGAQLKLPVLESITGQVKLEARSTGSQLEVPRLAAWMDNDRTALSLISAVSQGTIRSPLLTDLENVSIYLDGTLDTQQLTAVKHALISIFRGTPSFAALANMDGSGVLVSNAVAAFPAVTRFAHQGADRDLTWQVTTGGTLSLPNLAAIETNKVVPSANQDSSGAYELSMRAFSGGMLDLSALAAFEGGVVRVWATDAGSEVNLAALDTVTSDHPRLNHGFTVDNQARLRLNLLPPQLHRIDLTVGDGDLGLDTNSLTRFTQGTLTIDGTAPRFDNLEQFDGSSVEVQVGGVLTLPKVTIYIYDGAPVDRRFVASGTGSTLALPNLTQIVGRSDNDPGLADSVLRSAALELTLQAVNGGTLDLPQLASIQGTVSLATSSLTTTPESTLNAPALASLTSTHPRFNIALSAGRGMLRVGNLPSALDRVNLSVAGGLNYNLGALTALTHGQLDLSVPAALPNLANLDGSGVIVRNGVNLSLPLIAGYNSVGLRDHREFGALGTGSKLQLANLSEIVLQGMAATGIHLRAAQGGVLDLPGLRRLEVAAGEAEQRGIDVTAQSGGTVILTGLTSWADKASTIQSDLLVARGTVRLNAGETVLEQIDIQLSDSATAVRDSSRLEGGSVRLLRSDLEVWGAGAVVVGNLINEGRVAVRSFDLHVTGNYSQAESAELEVIIQENGSGRLSVDGGVNLEGGLHLNARTGYRPAAGAPLEFLNYAARQGVFSELDGDGYRFDLNYLPDRAVATPLADGEGEAPDEEFFAALAAVFEDLGR